MAASPPHRHSAADLAWLKGPLDREGRMRWLKLLREAAEQAARDAESRQD